MFINCRMSEKSWYINIICHHLVIEYLFSDLLCHWWEKLSQFKGGNVYFTSQFVEVSVYDQLAPREHGKTAYIYFQRNWEEKKEKIHMIYLDPFSEWPTFPH